MEIKALSLCGCILLMLLLLPQHALSANILISSMYGEGSHFMVGASIGQGLVDRGHHVTALISRAYEKLETDSRYSNLSFEIFNHKTRSIQEVHEFWHEFSTFALKESQEQLMKSLHLLISKMGEDCEGLLQDVALMKRLEDIDAIVMDVTWMCGVMIRDTLERNMNYTKKIRLVSVTPFTPQAVYLWLYGSTYNPSFMPELGTGYSNRMTLKERCANVFQTFLYLVIGTLDNIPVYTRIAHNMGLDPSKVDFWRPYKIFDLHLLNLDFAIEFPFPLGPNFIPVGGLTARPTEPLDEDLEAFMQSSGEHGVIVFTLGTYFSSITKMQPGFVDMFFEAFARLPQKVIWQMKYLPDQELPPNVRTMTWVPQNDLLGHPKTRVFMSHGGNNGFQEVCYHGIPFVVIPLHGDQYDVAARVEARGMGRKIGKLQLTAELIYETLNDVLNNPKYATVAKEVSGIIRNNPMTAQERAAFWVEHVIKFGGDYLISRGLELNFIQYYMLDVIALFCAIVFLILLVVFFVVRFCISLASRIVFGSAKSKLE